MSYTITYNNEDLHGHLHNNAQLNSEIIPSVEEQASLVAENIRRTTANTEMMGEIQATLSNLDKDYVRITNEITDTLWYMSQLDTAFLQHRQQIEEIQSRKDSLSTGITSLATGRLSAEFFPPKGIKPSYKGLCRVYLAPGT